MKNHKNALILALLILFGGLLIYIYTLKKEINSLQVRMEAKTHELSLLEEENTPAPFVKFPDIEQKIIGVIKDTDTYKKDLTYINSDNYLKFGDSTYTTNGIWYFGLLDYVNVYKSTNSYFPPPGKTIPIISQNWIYILKLNEDGTINKLTINQLTDSKTWNKSLNELPENVLPNDRKVDFLE